MAWIEVISFENSDGELREQYDQAIRRAGRVFNIVSIMSQNPASLKASMRFYLTIMFGPSPLSRGQRELLATVTSATNHCVY